MMTKLRIDGDDHAINIERSVEKFIDPARRRPRVFQDIGEFQLQ